MTDVMGLDLLAGQRIAGGCDYCDAYQTVEAVSPGVTRVRVHHDAWCSFLNNREARRRRAQAVRRAHRKRVKP